MGLRCLLGHDFGEPELRRTREEQGDEVIVTVSEVTTCRRCGATRVVGENKEITSIEQLAATAADPSDAAIESTEIESSSPESSPTTQPTPTTESSATVDRRSTSNTRTAGGSSAAEEDTEILPNEPAPSIEQTPFETDKTAVADTDTAAADIAESDTVAADIAERDMDSKDTDNAEPTTHADDETKYEASGADDTTPSNADDGIILPTDDERRTEREVGAWPEHDVGETEPAGEPTPWPEQTGKDTGYDASPPDGDRNVGGGSGFVPDIADAEGATTEEPADDQTRPESDAEEATTDATDEDATDDAELLGTDESGAVSGRAGEPDFDVEAFESAVDEIETEFVCPACGFSRRPEGSSMRAGDICPECKRGYIAERPLDQ